MKKISSDSGNWTRVSRVTGGDTNHYTKSDLLISIDTLILQKGSDLKNFKENVKFILFYLFSFSIF